YSLLLTGFEHVPNPAHRLDEPGATASVHLLPETVDHHVHDVGPGIEVIVPGVLGDQGPRHHPPDVPHQVLEDGKFLVGELDRLSAPGDFAGVEVELEIAHPQLAGRQLPGTPAQRLDPRQQLLKTEWLGDVIVGAGPERFDLEVHRVLRGEYQDRHAEPAIPKGPEHLHSVHAREPEIENDEVVLALRSDSQRFGPVRHQLGLMLLLFEAAFDVLTDRTVVFDDENLHSAAIPPTGRNTRKTEPRPGWLSTSMRPRCSATMP